MNTKNKLFFTFNVYTVIGITILTIILILVSWYVIDVLLLTFAGVLLSVFLRTLSNTIKRKIHVSDNLSMVLTLLMLIITLTIIVAIIIPIVSDQITKLFAEIPNAWNKLKQDLNTFLNLNSIYSIYQEINLDQYLAQGKTAVIQAANLFSTTFGFIGSILVFLFIGIFLAFDPETYRQGFLRLIPINKREKAKAVLDSLTVTLRWWMVGKMVSMTMVGILTSAGLWLLGVPLALTLGLLAAILTFIPNLGPILAAIPAILIAIVQSPTIAFYVIILYVSIQTIESYLITPIIHKNTISLPPVLVIIAQLVMGLLTGILGLALATPLLAVLIVIIHMLHIEKTFDQS